MAELTRIYTVEITEILDPADVICSASDVRKSVVSKSIKELFDTVCAVDGVVVTKVQDFISDGGESPDG